MSSIWYESLSERVERIAKLWALQELKPIQSTSTNYVLIGCRKADFLPTVLKIGIDRLSIEQEAAALRFYQGCGSVRLLDMDLSQGALLLERIIPGKSLKSFFPAEDDLSIEHTIKVMRSLHSIPIRNASGFPHVADWLVALQRDEGVAQEHLRKARDLARKLLQTAGTSVLLHGDLHHENILYHSQKINS